MRPAPLRWLLAALLAVAAHTAVGSANDGVLAGISFKPPYNTFDTQGNRQVPNYSFGGHATVNENFIRLTTDRASKRGWLWSSAPIDVEQWAATLRFRVSGQGKKLFGDGFTFWVTQEKFFENLPGGQGFPEKFVGFGVVFDTFRNTESSRPHRDVSLVIHNGDQDLTNGTVLGCDGDFRYWEGRDDFKPAANKSVALIAFNKDKITVTLDSKNKGEMSTCVMDVPLGLPPAWYKTAYVGVTATTGQLADNHDILSLLISTRLDTIVQETRPEEEYFSTGNPSLDTAIHASVQAASQPLIDKLDHLHHHLEHQLSSIQDTLANNIKRLQDQERSSLARIQEMEGRVAKRLHETLGDHVGSTLETNLNERLAAVEEVMKANMDLKVAEKLLPLVGEMKGKASQVGRSWLLPFIVVFVGVGAAAWFAYKKYRKLLKTNML